MIQFLKRYEKKAEGVVTVDFVTVSFAFLLFSFMVLEMALMYFNIQSAQKAAHMGARVAVVSDPAVAGLPATNGLAAGGIFGTSCNDASSPCTGFARLTCTGTACETAPFTRVLGRMQQFLGGLQADHVTVSYGYEGLGYAGGPVIPSVTVRIEGVPYTTGILGILLGSANPLGALPAVSVTLTGEDLSQAGG